MSRFSAVLIGPKPFGFRFVYFRRQSRRYIHDRSCTFRLLQFNLFNSTGKPGRADSITLYDGDIYNVTAKSLGDLEANSPDEKKLFKTQGPSLSIRLFANGASNAHGFIAEVVTLPISAIGFSK